MSRSRFAGPMAVLAILGIAACEQAGDPSAPERLLSTVDGAAPEPLECPTDVTLSGQAVIGPSGGTLRAGRHQVVIPAGALTETLTFTLAAPAGTPLLIEASAQGLEHVPFKKPVTVVVDYARCPAGEVDAGALSAWYVEGSPPQLLKRMSGAQEPAASTYRFYTDHFSGYVIAN